MSVSAPLLQVVRDRTTSENVRGLLKRPRMKNVTWATPECMHQVRLFAVEDAPASLGLVSQDLLEAKKVRMIRPSSAIDVHPGSGSAVTKRAKLEMATVLAMDAQLTWKCPKTVIYNPSWLVAAGEDSSEVPAQMHREVRVLEAFYPRVSAIPASPIELPKAELEIDTSNPLQIPLVSYEDDEYAHSGGIRSTTHDTISSGTSVGLAPQIDSDPDVAAAAAAAFAVLKAQERGSSIDRELLIKILSNPILTDYLKNSNMTLPTSGSNSVPAACISEPVENDKERDCLGAWTTLGRGTHAPPPVEKGVSQWQQGSPMGQPSSSNMRRSLLRRAPFYEQERGILGNGKVAYGMNTFMEQLYEDASKKLFPHSHIRCIPTNETLRQSPFFHESMAARNIVGLNCQPFLESGPSVVPPYPKKGTAVRERMPVAASAKIRKPCLFFNTPKGCRNGIHCNFLHEPPKVEPPYLTERTNVAEPLEATKS
ncbi:hypothetical protein GOP47_0001724 [Adiantum capillus-veneris]|uniref:C3H1-type domain-containing protein n=1 Tax=Adiantum capillus-veneris TaxID=13818 RepID=A0A9D4VA39_ADICA|nr:hypothetical protein GOP47_0001724 [Adiantum capillus-veneris]